VTAPSSTSPIPPRWIAPWLALLAPLYVISPLALLALPQLRRLPRPALWVLGFYAFSQQLPALFTPEPLLASVLALARTLLMFGLIGVGVALGDSQRLRPFAIGLGITFVTALGYSLTSGADIFSSRLSHPYMTSITLGIGGAFGIWIALFIQGRLWWRLPLGVLSLSVLLLSGSRGPLAAAVVGCLVGLSVQWKRRNSLVLLLGASLLGGGVLLGDRLGLQAISRLNSVDASGRDAIWYNTLGVINGHPLAGIGSYRLGKYISKSDLNCKFNNNVNILKCPKFVGSLGNPWSIAHNGLLQILAETGPFGSTGLLLLLSSALVMSLYSKNSITSSVFFGSIFLNIYDNTFLVPSPFFAEITFICVGLNLVSLRSLSLRPLAVTFSTVCVFIFPMSFGIIQIHNMPTASVQFLNHSAYYSPGREYYVSVVYRIPKGNYNLSINLCSNNCKEIFSSVFTSDSGKSPTIIYRRLIDDEPAVSMQLRLYRADYSYGGIPLLQNSWNLK
jgi:O-Antigen ligase